MPKLARRFQFSFAAVPDFVTADLRAGRLASVDLHILVELVRAARDGVAHRSAAQLAALVGKSVGTVKSALARLKAAGRILFGEPDRKHYPTAKRSIVVAWLRPAEADRQPLFPGGAGGADLTHDGSISDPDGPPAAPIRAPEEGPRDNDAPSPPPAGPSVESSSSPSEPPERRATKAEVAAAATHARALFPSEYFIPTAVRRAAKKYRLSWVVMALREAELAKARSWRYVTSTLERWQAQGYPSPRPEPIARSSSPVADAEETRRLLEERRRCAVEAEFSAPSPDELEAARRWVATGDARLRSIGAKILERAGT
jgi:hypothetical protein